MKKRLKRFLISAAVLVPLLLVILSLPFNPPKWTAAQISARVDLLNENASVTTPHLRLGEKTRAAHLALFGKVERGEPLSAEESAEYRVLYQSILKDNQSKLALLDDQLTVLTDFEPGAKNNVGTLGIAGAHDHHDASAGANLAALRDDLARLEGASGAAASITRVRAAISANKDLMDVILHMATAPQTKSVPYLPHEAADELQRDFEAVMTHFKRAQFEPVNSPAYVAEVHRALDAYDALVAQVQDRIYGHLGPVELSLSGRWGSWKSLGPSLRRQTANRIPRGTPPAP